MNTTKNIVLLIGIITCLAISSARVMAQNTPPKMPTFTESIVRQMLNDIDEAHNFSLLRAGYFGGHRKAPFPITDGFDVLKSTLETQKPGDLKWFLLQAVRGSAAFHSPGIPYDDGFDAYNQIFDNTNLATTPRAQAAVRTAVRDFVTINKENLGDSRAPEVLFKAWNISQQLPPSAVDQKRPLDWARAVKAANAQNTFLPIVESALKSTSANFQTLKLAIIVLQNNDKPRAIELLKTAQQKLLPGDRSNQKWLYETWAELITGSENNRRTATHAYDKSTLTRLAQMRRDQVSHTGTGYAELLELYWQLEQYDKANELMAVVKIPTIRPSEKINVAKVLLSPPRDLTFSKETTNQLQRQGVAILQDYLSAISAAKDANTNDEILARYELGRYFVKGDQITEALKVLDISNVKATPRNSMAAFYYTQIVKMNTELAEKLKSVEGAR